MMRFATVALVALLASCGDDSGPPATLHWTVPGKVIPAGQEFYECFFVHAATGGTDANPRGVVKFSYAAESPVVHHVVLFTSNNNEPDGTWRHCAILEGGWDFRYAGGKQTGALVMPDGVATPVKPNEVYVFQFHYLNATSSDVTDHSAMDITYTKPGASYTLAGLAVAGKLGFTIPTTGTPYTIDATCTVPMGATSHIFAIWPHMHQIGTHFAVDLVQNGVTTTPIDEDWTFGDQALWVYAADRQFLMNSGDEILTHCTYVNNTGAPVSFGESSTQEMCFNLLYFYPATQVSTFCLQ
jgi:copper type II ascorbate-dependent monooxygenase-like protein